jgi:cell division protein FtsW
MKTLARKAKSRVAAAAPERAPARPVPSPSAAKGEGEGWEAGALALLTLVTFSFGVVELYGASAFLAQAEDLPGHYFAVRQLLGGVVGVGMTLLLARMDYRKLRLLAWPLLAGALALLLLVVLPGTEGIAPRVNGARRWLNLGVQFQPSEFAKVALIVWTAALAVKKQDRLHSLSKGLLPFLVVWLAVVLLVFLQPNLSAALLLALLASLVLFAGGARIGHFILLGLVTVPVVWSQIKAAPYRFERLIAYWNPEADTGGITYQIYQSLIAVGSGGLGGMGFGNSRQKFGFLPEPHNDFLFSLVAEEWGIVGIAFVAALFLAFAAVGYRIASRAPDRFGYLLAIGMTNLVSVSAFLHMGVALALLPTTGVSLPFMSYGRSALLTAFAAVGILLSVARAGRKGAPGWEAHP